MAYKNHWLQSAIMDLDNIYLFYKQVASENVAKRRLSKIFRETDRLEFMPSIGQVDEEFQYIPSY
jgi:plasmid stabilization system protein ParE